MLIEGLSQFESIMVYAIGTAIVGAAGVLTWIVKSALPRVVAFFGAHLTELTSAVAKMPAAVASVVAEVREAEVRTAARIEVAKDAVIEEISDKRMSELTAIVRGHGPPSLPSIQ